MNISDICSAEVFIICLERKVKNYGGLEHMIAQCVI